MHFPLVSFNARSPVIQTEDGATNQLTSVLHDVATGIEKEEVCAVCTKEGGYIEAGQLCGVERFVNYGEQTGNYTESAMIRQHFVLLLDRKSVV